MRFAKTHSPSQEDTRKVKAQTTAQTVEVRADGEGLVSHANRLFGGLQLLGVEEKDLRRIVCRETSASQQTYGE